MARAEGYLSSVRYGRKFPRARSGYDLTVAGEAPHERGHGPWKDERRGPGYFPQGRRRPYAVIAIAGVGLLANFLVRHVLTRVELAAFVILIGLGSFWAAAKMNEKRLEDERYARGPGWFIGWLISKTSVPVARAFYVILGIGICALGIAGLAMWA
jgi:hypothetical protein